MACIGHSFYVKSMKEDRKKNNSRLHIYHLSEKVNKTLSSKGESLFNFLFKFHSTLVCLKLEQGQILKKKI